MNSDMIQSWLPGFTSGWLRVPPQKNTERSPDKLAKHTQVASVGSYSLVTKAEHNRFQISSWICVRFSNRNPNFNSRHIHSLPKNILSREINR
uniref:Pi n=1 Tax=Lettuce mild yellows virus TaxID=1667234 RepID=A0A0P1CZH4_9VIRU|nr:Pi [Lettuce mild yellows virus]